MAGQETYRRWAFESAALDLALRQAGRSLGAALGLAYRPVRFVVSTRLDITPWLARRARRSSSSSTRPPSGTTQTMARIAATGRVRALDFKSFYEGTPVDSPARPDRSTRPSPAPSREAVLEDPALEGPAREALRGRGGALQLRRADPLVGRRRGRGAPRRHRSTGRPMGRGRSPAPPQHQAVALRLAARAARLRRARPDRRHRALRRRPVRARRRPRTTSRRSPACSTPTGRTTSRPPSTTARRAPGVPASPLVPLEQASRVRLRLRAVTPGSHGVPAPPECTGLARLDVKASYWPPRIRRRRPCACRV